MEFRTQNLKRYILPLREGGSLPALAEADDGFRYAVKLRGSGHGIKSLIAEFIGGAIAKSLKFNVPELVFLNLSPVFGITEPDYEVQQLLRNSEGLNIGLHFLDRAMTFDPSVNHIDGLTASKIVWIDSFIENIDRSRQNPNMMIWDDRLWLIDHGSSLYFQNTGKSPEEAAADPFPYIRNHVFLPYADRLDEADRLMKQAITPRTLEKIVDNLPEEWLKDDSDSETTPEEKRNYYKTYLTRRLSDTGVFVEQAKKEREILLKG